MRIRHPAPADADAVADLFLAAKAEMTYLPQLDTDTETRRWVSDVVLRDLEVWVAEEGDRVVGFAALGNDLLEHLYVHPQEQKRGIGSELLAVSKKRRPHGLRLWVFQKNTGARRFYERHGFSLVRLTDGRDNEEREPDAFYEWRPQPASALEGSG
jgi:ribosomal protein S18 acetylase RimI-like enzyme